ARSAATRSRPPPRPRQRGAGARRPARRAMSAPDAAAVAAQKMLAWLSPAFPVGGYAYSHGLEWAIAAGGVADAGSWSAWIGDILRHGAGRNDAILLVHAWRAAASDDPVALLAIAELGAAFQPSQERHLEATAQGRAFLSAVCATWPEPRLLIA